MLLPRGFRTDNPLPLSTSPALLVSSWLATARGGMAPAPPCGGWSGGGCRSKMETGDWVPVTGVLLEGKDVNPKQRQEIGQVPRVTKPVSCPGRQGI